MSRIDIAGQRFGRLVAIDRGRVTERRETLWVFQCDCGVTKEIRAPSVISGRSRSCGCLALELAKKRHTRHGHASDRRPSSEYRTWYAMKDRCRNPAVVNYHNYGGRGIQVCERWRESFEAFLADMGPRPAPGFSLDRIDNDGPYSPDNCRWASRSEQANNRRTSVLHEFRGSLKSAAQIAHETGINQDTIWGRLKRGMSAEAAVTTPIRGRK